MVLSIVLVFLVYVGFNLLFLWLVSICERIKSNYGWWGFIGISAGLAFVVFGLVWGTFKYTSAICISYIRVLTPHQAFAHIFLLVIQGLTALITIGAIWYAPDHYTATSITFCLIGSYMVYDLFITLIGVIATSNNSSYEV